MPARFLALLGLFALLFTGCDFIDEIQPEAGVAVTIASITVENLPDRRWDSDGTGPDLFMEVQDNAGNAYLSSATVPDVEGIEQPMTFTFDGTFEVSSPSSLIKIVVFDEDGGGRVGAEVVGASASFTSADVQGADGSFVLESLYAELGRISTYTVVK